MKKTLAVAGLGAALAAAALLGAGPASASSGTFLSAVHNAGFYNNYGDHMLVSQGHQVCNFLYQGYSSTTCSVTSTSPPAPR